MPRRLAYAWLALGLGACAVYLALPMSDAKPGVYQGIGVACVLGIVLGTIRNRPQRPLPWLLFAGGLGLFVAGDAVWYVDLLRGVVEPFPSLGDVFYLSAYPMLGVAVVTFVRSDRAGTAATALNATIFGLGTGLLVWSLLIEPAADLHHTPIASQATAALYPTLDALLFAAFAQAFVAMRVRTAGAYAMLTAFGLLTLFDVFYVVALLDRSYRAGCWIDGGWLVAYTLWGFAALHPSMRPLSRLRATPMPLSRARLGLLAVASFAAPVSFLLEPAGEADVLVAGLWSAVLIAAIFVRMGLLFAQHRRGELEREQLARQNALLLQSAGQGIVATDRDGRVTLANPAAQRMLGRSLAELLGGELTAPDCARVAASTSPIVEDGETIGLVHVFTDIGERVDLEAQLRQAQKMEAVGRLAGGVAHDFNNLLTAISGYAELALERVPAHEPRLRLDLEEVRKAAERAVSLTQQLLAFGRRQMLLPQVLDLNAVVVETEKLLARVIGEDVEIRLDLRPGVAATKADPTQLTQVLLNLAVNARDAMPEGGVLAISTADAELDAAGALRLAATPGRYVVLTVADTGHGMDAETKARLFEPFFTTKDLGRGTGLGLATVYGIVSQSGGAISVESERGHGATFRVYLPRADDAPERGEERDAQVEGGAETVLLVEDEEVVRKLLADMLRKQGYRVVVADGPAAALELAAGARRCDLLVTDVVMPGMTGRELAARLREDDRRLKVLYVTGYAADVELGDGDDRASSAVLQKPFSLEDFAGRVRALLDERAKPAAAA